MSNISVKSMASAMINVDNSTQEDRAHDVSARVAIKSGEVGNIDAGYVMTGDTVNAEFTYYGSELLVRFKTGDRPAVLASVESFVDDAKSSLGGGSYTLEGADAEETAADTATGTDGSPDTGTEETE